jgi:hypothetical protein
VAGGEMALFHSQRRRRLDVTLAQYDIRAAGVETAAGRGTDGAGWLTGDDLPLVETVGWVW